jgi:hypothetical protein
MFLSAAAGAGGIRGFSARGLSGRGRRFCLAMLSALAQRHTGSQQKHSAQFEQVVVQWIFTHFEEIPPSEQAIV